MQRCSSPNNNVDSLNKNLKLLASEIRIKQTINDIYLIKIKSIIVFNILNGNLF